MRRSTNLGLATAAIGLAIVIGGLRSAVAGGGVCTGHGNNGSFWCAGSCPNGDACVETPFPDWTGTGLIVLCGCKTKDGGLYSPIDAPNCALFRHSLLSSTFYFCKAQGCRTDCFDASCDAGGKWSCPCPK